MAEWSVVWSWVTCGINGETGLTIRSGWDWKYLIKRVWIVKAILLLRNIRSFRPRLPLLGKGV
jgi:hypothetical protein